MSACLGGSGGGGTLGEPNHSGNQPQHRSSAARRRPLWRTRKSVGFTIAWTYDMCSVIWKKRQTYIIFTWLLTPISEFFFGISLFCCLMIYFLVIWKTWAWVYRFLIKKICTLPVCRCLIHYGIFRQPIVL